MPRPQTPPAATSTRPVTSSAWRPRTRDDERAARAVSEGRLATTPRRVVVGWGAPGGGAPPVRGRDREREEPWRVVTMATTLPAATPATGATWPAGLRGG